MISSLLCFPCKLCTNNISILKQFASPIGLYLRNTNGILPKNYCNYVKDPLTDTSSVDQRINTFKEIYRLPSIRLGYYLHKLKWYQSVAAAVVIPSTLVLYFCGVIDSTYTMGVILPGVSLTLNLYGLSLMFVNAVGFVYVREDEATLKISYLDFWGKRIDEKFPVDDVVPFLDAPRPPTDYLYKQVVFYSSDSKKLKLFLKSGQITDKGKFDKVFGPLE